MPIVKDKHGFNTFANFHIFKFIIMAKAAKTAIKTKDQKAAAEAKNWTKVIRAVRSPKSALILLKKLSFTRTRSKNFLAQK